MSKKKVIGKKRARAVLMSQIAASARYDEKMGLATKSYKLKREYAEAFREACIRNGVPQSKVLNEFMRSYSEDVPASPSPTPTNEV
ncbi:MAG: hypothetical protein FWG63_02170 [Defluviitaleaceae bacterium]|nr:hypothetical protein [Defluviitaleaceae bacterium]